MVYTGYKVDSVQYHKLFLSEGMHTAIEKCKSNYIEINLLTGWSDIMVSIAGQVFSLVPRPLYFAWVETEGLGNFWLTQNTEAWWQG